MKILKWLDCKNYSKCKLTHYRSRPSGSCKEVDTIKITIDTVKDSPEEIEKAIQLLSSLTNSRIRSNDVFNSNSSLGESQEDNAPKEVGVFNMFNKQESSSTMPVSEQKEDEEEISKVQVMQY